MAYRPKNGFENGMIANLRREAKRVAFAETMNVNNTSYRKGYIRKVIPQVHNIGFLVSGKSFSTDITVKPEVWTPRFVSAIGSLLLAFSNHVKALYLFNSTHSRRLDRQPVDDEPSDER